MSRNRVMAGPDGSAEVVGVARLRFTDAFKGRSLDKVERARPGKNGLVLRHEGLYSSPLANWRN